MTREEAEASEVLGLLKRVAKMQKES